MEKKGAYFRVGSSVDAQFREKPRIFGGNAGWIRGFEQRTGAPEASSSPVNVLCELKERMEKLIRQVRQEFSSESVARITVESSVAKVIKN